MEYSRIRELRLAALKPRKAAFTIPGSNAVEEDFQGFFRLRRTFADGKGSDDVDLLLLRNGDEVTGSYSNATGQGFVEGKISDGVLRFTWNEGQRTHGHGQVESKGECDVGHRRTRHRRRDVGRYACQTRVVRFEHEDEHDYDYDYEHEPL